MPVSRRPDGFTLIEVLVVMLIVGIALGSLSLGAGALERRDGEREARRLRQVLEAVAERAEVRGEPLAVELLADGYRFSRFDTDGGWRPLHEPPVFAERLLPAGLAWRGLRIDGREVARPWRLVFGARAPRFTLELALEARALRLEGRESGLVTLESADPQTP